MSDSDLSSGYLDSGSDEAVHAWIPPNGEFRALIRVLSFGGDTEVHTHLGTGSPPAKTFTIKPGSQTELNISFVSTDPNQHQLWRAEIQPKTGGACRWEVLSSEWA